jgi:hypothetical protein
VCRAIGKGPASTREPYRAVPLAVRGAEGMTASGMVTSEAVQGILTLLV